MSIRLEPWGKEDLPLLQQALGEPSLLGPCEFEYPKGNWMRCNDWRLDLSAG